jgi:hypothetical protein
VEFVIILVLSGILTAIIASMKNYSGPLWFVLGFFFPVVAPIVIIFFRQTLTEENAPPSPETHVKCPDCKELVRKDANVCKHCGCKLTPENAKIDGVNSTAITNENPWESSRDLNNSEYQIYLVKKYGIEKNEALGKIVVGSKTYSTIEEALATVSEQDVEAHKEKQETMKRKEYIKSTGKIGGGIFEYTERGDGSILATHPSGLIKEFASMDDAKEYFGEK